MGSALLTTSKGRVTCGDNVKAGIVSSVTTLPEVDLSADSGQLRDRLRGAAHEVGFFYLTGHGVPETLTRRVLDAAHRLFALPQADKDTVAMIRSPHFRGYTRLGGEVTRGRVDWREQIDIGPERAPIGGPGKPDYLWLQGPNQWPPGVPELPDVVAQWDTALAAVAHTLLRHWAASLGNPPDVFDTAFADAPATLIKIVHYPAEAGSSQGVGAHRDSGVLTLLLAEPGSQGLQVRTRRDGGWVDVPGCEGAFIVNIGELLECATSGYLRATEHRVNLQGAADRISVPYFFNPRLDAKIPTLTLPAELAGDSGVRADPADPIFAVYGANAWKSRLRAHPDVAAAHGYVTGTAEVVTPGG